MAPEYRTHHSQALMEGGKEEEEEEQGPDDDDGLIIKQLSNGAGQRLGLPAHVVACQGQEKGSPNPGVGPHHQGSPGDLGQSPGPITK